MSKAIHEARNLGYNAVMTAAGAVPFSQWTVPTDNMEMDYNERALVGPWRSLTTFEEMIKEQSPELANMEMARDRWELTKIDY